MMARSTSDSTQVLRALSWNISFPRYARFEGRRDPLILNKLNQSCPGLDAAVGEHLYAAAGLPSSRVRYRRLYVNGGYYDYALDIEVPDEDMLRRTTPPGVRVGDLFKASGNSGVQEGPWGRADGQPLAASCAGRTPSFQPLDRYAYSYERKTWDWKDACEIADPDHRARRRPGRRQPERQQRRQRQPRPGARRSSSRTSTSRRC